MKDISSMNSLINYLNAAGNKIYLNLPGASQDRSHSEENVFPRTEIGDSDPLGRLIEASLTTDAGSQVKKLFLLAQRDVYFLKNNVLWPLNNIDVRNAWQRSFAFYTDPKRNDESFILFADQVGDKGEILPFPSLFYCKTKKVFFHPPCPACGRILRQCEDDSLLAASALPLFSASLRRFLHCPACGTPDFYACEREPGDSPSLKDRRDLVRNFAGLKKAEETANFPCADCSLHAECYGGENRCLERIAPFSFYPFYMLAVEAASLNAVDFIPLLSGAGFPEAKRLAENSRASGRIASVEAVSRVCAGHSPFLFDSDERRFLEILYLKLAFLAEVIRNFQSGGQFDHPDLKPGMDQIWIKFPEISGMLPLFWNFNVRILGVGREESTFPVLKTTPDTGMLLGLIWFYTLLSNKKQSMSDVLSGLKKYSREDAGSFEKMTRESIFDASNIFWDPQGKTVPAAWKNFWEKSLSTGWSLLTSGFQSADDTGAKCLEQVAQLRKDIKENLFLKEIPHAAAAPQEAEKVLPGTKDEAIRDILLGLIDKFQSAKPAPQKAAEAKVSGDLKLAAGKADLKPAPAADEDIEEPVIETVVFSSRSKAGEGAVSPAEATQVIARHTPSREVPMESQETLILSLDRLQSEAKPKAKEDDLLEKTLIMSAQPAAPATPVAKAEKTSKSAQTIPFRDAPPEIQETLILSLKDLESGTKPKTGAANHLEETLILSTQAPGKVTSVPPAEKTPKVSSPSPVREVPEESQETLILSVGNPDQQRKPTSEKTGPVPEETLILSTFVPGAKETEKTRGETGQKTISQRDLLEETVILRPGEKSKDGAKK